MLKVVDQGADDTTNAVSIRAFFQKVADSPFTTRTTEATIIQTRHRIPEEQTERGGRRSSTRAHSGTAALSSNARNETRKMHALEEYGLMHVKLYEDIARTAISPRPTPTL